MAAKRKYANDDDDNESFVNSERISVPSHIRNQQKRLIIVLENANLETVKVGKNFELLNCDDHRSQMKKYNKNPGQCRPDIVHQCLLMLFDSPLNRAGFLQVYVHTEKNVLIEINPQTRIPRTFKRFAGLIVQLLHKLSIHAADGPQKLLKVIKNPITDHLPVGCKKLVTSYHANKLVHPRELAPPNEPVVIVIGAMAHGSVDVDYSEELLAISEYPLSAALTCSKLCTGFEEAWGIQ
ncbi:LOW QUALITY PROTEIN: ribosomal RNA small subunit methyltransferase NEP1 [Tachypleus tridentatus]|uniref:LOW QUALITY PROTEIN: ribosomal RNA small subunit methyltransferase NEP1 n=1 Tax=Tachypleus tridentatus TaxID=6853 RepID=UPI003FD0E72E